MKVKINKRVVYFVMPVIVLVVGFILRIWQFNSTYTISELQRVNMGSFPISEMLGGHFASPAYYFLLHLWLKLVPVDELSARLFSILTGTLALIALYFLVLRLKDKKAALIAVYLGAISPFYIFHSRMIGDSAPGLLLILLSIILFMKLYEERNDVYNSIAYTAVTLLMLYSTPGGGLVLLCEWCWLGLKWQVTKQKLRLWLISQGVIILGYVYWVVMLFGNSFDEFKQAPEYNLPGRFLYVLHSFSLGQSGYPFKWTVIVPTVFVSLLIIVIGVISLRRQRRIGIYLWPLFLINLLPVLWSCGLPEYCMGASVGYLIVVALGVSQLPFRSVVMALGLITYFSWVGIGQLF